VVSKRVTILTDFYVYDEAYSLCGVVSEQLEMLEDYKPILVVDQAFPQRGTPWHEFEIRRIPGVPRSNVIKIDDTWDQDIEVLQGGIEMALCDAHVVVSHDMIYQPSMVKMHIAARKVAAVNPHIRWLHWIHSATPSFAKQHAELVRGQFPNSKIVFPNEYDRARVAQNYNVPETDVVFVPHSTDPLTFIMAHPLSRDLAKEINLLEADVIGCYPARLDRGKQVEMVLEIFAGIKQTGRSVRCIIFDFHSTGGDKVTYREWLMERCAEMGLSIGHEIVFTSQWRKETNLSCPRQMIRDFMLVGDVFILPSRSETYSLVAQEAAMCKNLLMLNFDFSPMRNIYGENALYGKFSSNIDALSGEEGETTTKYSDRQGYMNSMALKIIARLEESMVLRQFRFRRKHRNPKAVFRDYFEPLLWGGA